MDYNTNIMNPRVHTQNPYRCKSHVKVVNKQHKLSRITTVKQIHLELIEVQRTRNMIYTELQLKEIFVRLIIACLFNQGNFWIFHICWVYPRAPPFLVRNVLYIV